MKQDHIPTRRQPVRKTLHARFFNKTKPRKQRAAAAAPPMDEVESSGINISRSLSIIFLIHIIAIGMIFIHKQYLSGRTVAPVATVAKTDAGVKTDTTELPKLSNGDKIYRVEKGDNYTIIADKYHVDENELRNTNRGVDIRPGVVLRIPKTKRIVAVAPPEVTAITDNMPVNNSERGLVEILPPADSDTPLLIRPNVSRDGGADTSEGGAGGTHTVKSGDNIWRIATQYKVDQNKLMEANNIKDPTKLRIGQVLKIP